MSRPQRGSFFKLEETVAAAPLTALMYACDDPTTLIISFSGPEIEQGSPMCSSPDLVLFTHRAARFVPGVKVHRGILSMFADKQEGLLAATDSILRNRGYRKVTLTVT
jgi:hypothetical protein